MLVHGGALAGLALIDDPEPKCPTEEEMCRQICGVRPPTFPKRCVPSQECVCTIEVVTNDALPPPPELVAPPVVPPPPPEPKLAHVDVPPVEAPAEPEAAEPEPDPPPPAGGLEPRRSKVDREAIAKAASIAKVLGTYGGPGEGTVLDVIESTDNDLGKLFEQGMSTTVRGGPTPEVTDPGDEDKALGAYLRRRIKQLQACHREAVRADPAAENEGTLHVTLDIAPLGKVTHTAFGDDDPALPAFRRCVTSKTKTWRFPSADAAHSVDFAITIVTE